MEAAIEGSTGVVQVLLDHGAELELKNKVRQKVFIRAPKSLGRSFSFREVRAPFGWRVVAGGRRLFDYFFTAAQMPAL